MTSRVKRRRELGRSATTLQSSSNRRDDRRRIDPSNRSQSCQQSIDGLEVGGIQVEAGRPRRRAFTLAEPRDLDLERLQPPKLPWQREQFARREPRCGRRVRVRRKQLAAARTEPPASPARIDQTEFPFDLETRKPKNLRRPVTMPAPSRDRRAMPPGALLHPFVGEKRHRYRSPYLVHSAVFSLCR